MALVNIGSKAVCGFDVFNVSPKGTEAKEASNLLAFLNLLNTLEHDKSFAMILYYHMA